MWEAICLLLTLWQIFFLFKGHLLLFQMLQHICVEENDFSRKQSKTKQSKVQMGVWLLKVIYKTGRKKRRKFFFTLQPSCPDPCLLSQRDMGESQPGGSNLKKTFIKIKTGQYHLQPRCQQVHKGLKFQQGEAGHSGVGSINPTHSGSEV